MYDGKRILTSRGMIAGENDMCKETCLGICIIRKLLF